MEQERSLESLRRVAQRRGRNPQAYLFLYEALEQAQRDHYGAPQHVTGPELAEGWRDRAIALFGPLARTVMEAWKVRTTDDIGDMVFDLVDAGLMRKKEHDRPEDFHAVFDLMDALDPDLVLEECPARLATPPFRPVARDLPGAERASIGQK